MTDFSLNIIKVNIEKFKTKTKGMKDRLYCQKITQECKHWLLTSSYEVDIRMRLFHLRT